MVGWLAKSVELEWMEKFLIHFHVNEGKRKLLCLFLRGTNFSIKEPRKIVEELLSLYIN